MMMTIPRDPMHPSSRRILKVGLVRGHAKKRKMRGKMRGKGSFGGCNHKVIFFGGGGAGWSNARLINLQQWACCRVIMNNTSFEFVEQ
jgi:hypothetical protein